MNQFGFRIQSGKRDLGIWWVMGFDESDARERLTLSFSGTNIAEYGYVAVLESTRIFGEVPA